MIAIWLGTAAPLRSVRWLDGALAAAARFGPATALAAGDATWLDLAADRATRAGLASAGIQTDLQLDYLGWAQVVAAAVRELGATTVLVDQASRPERLPEVAALAELLDAVQLTHVVAIAPEDGVVHVTRVSGRELQTLRLRGRAVLGLRIAGAALDDYPTPSPSAAMRRLELTAIGLDPVVLAHRALAPRSAAQPRKTVERIVEHLALHLVAPSAPRKGPP